MGKRQWEPTKTTMNSQPPPNLRKQDIPSSSNTPETFVDQIDSVEIIDLTMSSPPAPEQDIVDVADEPFYVSSNTVSGSSSPIAYGSEDEEEVCKLPSRIEFILTKAISPTSWTDIRVTFSNMLKIYNMQPGF